MRGREDGYAIRYWLTNRPGLLHQEPIDSRTGYQARPSALHAYTRIHPRAEYFEAKRIKGNRTRAGKKAVYRFSRFAE